MPRYPITTHTRGTTYSRAGLYTLPAGHWTAAATVSTGAGVLVEALSVTLAAFAEPDADGNTHALSVLSDASETALWPLASLLQDIIFTDDSATPVKVPAVTTQITVSAHTATSDPGDPLRTITGDMAPVLRGAGVPAGGSAGQVLVKASDTDMDMGWGDQTGGGAGTNLAYAASPTAGTVTSNTGTDATIPAADATHAGLMLPAQVAKLAALSGTNTGDQDLSGYALTSHDHAGAYDPAGSAAGAVSAHALASDPHGDRAFATSADATVLSSAAADATSKANAAAAASTPAAHAGAGGSAHADAIAAGAAGFMSGSDKSKLDGIASGATVAPSTTDGLTEGVVNLYSTAARIRATILTGLSTAAGTVVDAAHTVLEALGFLQRQVSDNTTAIAGKQATLVSGTSLKTINSTSLLGSGDIAVSASPGGSTGQVQYNNAGALGGDAGMAYDGDGALTLSKRLIVPSGSPSALPIKFGSTNSGFYLEGGFQVYVVSNGAVAAAFDRASNYFCLGTTAMQMVFGYSGPYDLGIGYASAGVARITDGGNNFRDLKLRKLIASGSHTDASNGRWLELSMDSAGIAEIKPTGNGTGASGNVLHISGLPTSNPGPGILWNNVGIVAIGT